MMNLVDLARKEAAARDRSLNGCALCFIWAVVLALKTDLPLTVVEGDEVLKSRHWGELLMIRPNFT